MDPVSLAAAAVMPFLVNYAQHLAGLAGKVVDEAVTDRLRAIWEAVKTRFAGDSQAGGALGRLAEQPDNPRRQAAVEDHLDEVIEKDPAFAAELAQLVRSAERTATISDVVVRDSGAVAMGGDVTISAGGHAAGRDVTISDAKNAGGTRDR
jgi:hypothetical protein